MAVAERSTPLTFAQGQTSLTDPWLADGWSIGADPAQFGYAKIRIDQKIVYLRSWYETRRPTRVARLQALIKIARAAQPEAAASSETSQAQLARLA